jgi:hypothetical protein
MGTFFRQGDIKKPVKPVFHAESDRGGHLFITITKIPARRDLSTGLRRARRPAGDSFSLKFGPIGTMMKTEA